jgi:hypothetical protein
MMSFMGAAYRLPFTAATTGRYLDRRLNRVLIPPEGISSMRVRTALAGLLLATAAPVVAQLADPFTAVSDPADRAVMAEAAAAITGPTPDLAALDAVLVKLPRPTALRGVVQTVRAALLSSKERTAEAVAAVEEAMRLLPDDPRPKLVATELFTFSGSPQRAADLWVQASRESPEYARMTDPYLLSALVGRLVEGGDRSRADRLTARMGEIGYSAASVPDRSSSALARARTQVEAGQTDLAVQSVTAIGDPNDLLLLYLDKRYRLLWPRIAEWAGPDLDDQSRRYLEELRGAWIATDDFETAAPYARRLASLGAHQTVVTLFLPMLDRLSPERSIVGAEFIAPVVARALVRVGREPEARALLTKVATAMPKNDTGNDLNITGAMMLIDSTAARWPETIAQADLFLRRAQQLKSTINASATLQVRSMRACALSKLGRESEAQEDVAAVLLGEALLPGPAMQLHLCRGDVSAARALLIRRLADDATRGWALAFVQPSERDPFSAYERMTQPVAEQVRAASDVRSAASTVGRFLPHPVLTGLPKGFDPFRAPRPSGVHGPTT